MIRLDALGRVPASRDELLNGLFDGRDDESTRSYLRKAIIGVRRRLPPDAVSVGADGRVGLSPDIVLASESVRHRSRRRHPRIASPAAALTAVSAALADTDPSRTAPASRTPVGEVQAVRRVTQPKNQCVDRASRRPGNAHPSADVVQLLNSGTTSPQSPWQ